MSARRPKASADGGTAAQAPRKRGKPRGIRRDRDCLTCKRRGLKCDLNRPQCLPCVQAGLVCGGYPLRVVWPEERKRAPGVAEDQPADKAREATAEPRDTSSKATCPITGTEAPPAATRRESTARKARPPRTSPATAPGASSFSFSDPPPSSCPPSHPLSPTANRNASLASSPTLARSNSTSSTSPAVVTDLSPPSTNDGEISTLESWSETDQNSLIKRLAAICSHILSTEDAQALTNQYLSPETIRLLSDLCVFIQARLEGRNPPAATGVENRAESVDIVRHRLATLANVNRAIEAANPFAFLGIATFAVFEVCDTTFGEWQFHLYGARYLLDYHHCRSIADLQRLARFVPGLMDILARLIWFDVSGTIVRGIEDDSCENEGTPKSRLVFDDWHRAVLDDDFFGTVGCPPDTFALYVEVAKGHLGRHPVQSCLRAAEQVLKLDTFDESDWGVSANVQRCAVALAILDQIPDDDDDDDNDDRLANVMADANARHAHRKTKGTTSAKAATTAAAVAKLCRVLDAAPPSSRFYIHMALSAYLAGMHAQTLDQCDTVRRYWQNCNITGISRYPGGQVRCEKRWRRVGLIPAEEAAAPAASAAAGGALSAA